jgi:hypothetical protein
LTADIHCDPSHLCLITGVTDPRDLTIKLIIVYWNTIARDGLVVIVLYDYQEPDIIIVQEP